MLQFHRSEISKVFKIKFQLFNCIIEAQRFANNYPCVNKMSVTRYGLELSWTKAINPKMTRWTEALPMTMDRSPPNDKSPNCIIDWSGDLQYILKIKRDIWSLQFPRLVDSCGNWVDRYWVSGTIMDILWKVHKM